MKCPDCGGRMIWNHLVAECCGESCYFRCRVDRLPRIATAMSLAGAIATFNEGNGVPAVEVIAPHVGMVLEVFK